MQGGINFNFTTYNIRTPNYNIGNYNNDQMCTYNFPPPQKEHVYEYLFLDNSPPSIEKSTASNFRCLDSLQFEHNTENLSTPVITCGDEIDDYKQIDGHEAVLSDIRITFRSNEEVQKSGANFFIYEYFGGVCCP